MGGKERRHLTMLREFRAADFITLANGFTGTGSVLAVMQHLVSGEERFLWIAFGLLPLSLLFDFLDGRVARWRGGSVLGPQLDSLADLISFGLAPAALGFAVGLRGGWDAAVLIFFVACGLSRLARFNATADDLADETGKVKYFEGTPIPTSLLLVAGLAFLVYRGQIHDALPLGEFELGPWRLHPLVLIYLASGFAMVSKTLKIPKF